MKKKRIKTQNQTDRKKLPIIVHTHSILDVSTKVIPSLTQHYAEALNSFVDHFLIAIAIRKFL